MKGFSTHLSGFWRKSQVCTCVNPGFHAPSDAICGKNLSVLGVRVPDDNASCSLGDGVGNGFRVNVLRFGSPGVDILLDDCNLGVNLGVVLGTEYWAGADPSRPNLA